MPIKSKDGNVYQLRHPNKLMLSQVRIDKNKLIFHNCEFQDEFAQQEKPVLLDKPVEREPAPLEVSIAALVQEIEEIAPPVEPEPESEFPQLNIKTLFHCLPAFLSSHKDDLYDSSWQKINYGKKFIFPGVMIDQMDLMITFWTSDPKKQIAVQSIIFPFAYEVWNKSTKRYDRVPYDQYRWWRVNGIEPKDGGYLFTAIPSDRQPDFSDSD